MDSFTELNVTQSIIYDSVRVDGRGDGVIHEVQLRDKPSVHEETDSPKVAGIRAKVEEKRQEVDGLRDRESVLQRRIEVLDKIVGEVGESVVKHPKETEEPFILNEETLGNLTKFYSFYDESSMGVRTEQRTVKKSLEKAERELRALEMELQRAEADCNMHHYSKSILISLESEEGGKVVLEVTYHVHGASWRPSYDMRVETSAAQSLKVKQRTVKKSLEKAERELRALEMELQRAEADCNMHNYSKSILISLESEKGGKVELEVTYQVHGASWRPSYDMRVETSAAQSLKVGWVYARIPSFENNFHNMLDFFQKTGPMPRWCLSTAQPCLGGQIPELGVLEAVFYRPPAPAPVRPQMKMMALGGAPSARSASLFGSNSIESMRMEAAPMMDMAVAAAAPVEQHALSTEFVIAKPAAIPSDGAEHKTSLKNVSPGERFSCSLGVDPALRVEYKPVKKYHEQIGLINKASSTVHEQVIVVKNSRSDPVLLTVKEHVPRSTDEKIKVRLIAPVVSPSDESNNVSEKFAY
ncbi:hypothetical protein OESDEN_01903 [Oesophagostomum dentatum]|uniref:DUF4139 domain-containing protein n=1 Tax=Oesophagostomum dentatum TaxID=61180 RepID=A0A0B1TQM9_OESDE|nr:hypothetical protein OESDEN_01903 [Oesophagostomum dentatum]